jgi:hypothetical protein
MPTTVSIPWPLLLSTLRRTDDGRLSWAQVAATGAAPQALVDAKVLTYAGAYYESPDCECEVEPDLDWNTREAEGVVGVACVAEPNCFRGWQWVPRGDAEWLRCRAVDVLRALGPLNGLAPLGKDVPRPFVGVGLLRRRGLAVAVVWLGRPGPEFEATCLGLRKMLGHDALVVMTPRRVRLALPVSERIALLELVEDGRGDLQLGRAMEELTPDYRSRVIEDPLLDLDYVRMRFSTRPGDRHVVEINGHDFGGFRKSDVKFLRLLLLATARKYGPNDGWLDKSRLRDGDDKDRALERMREELVTYDVPGLPEEERRALVRANKGQLRLGVPPENIELDPSLAALEFIAPTTTVRSSGAKGNATAKQAEGIRNATVLRHDISRLSPST